MYSHADRVTGLIPAMRPVSAVVQVSRASATLGCGWRADQLVKGGRTGVTTARLERPSGQGDSGLHMPLLNSLYAALSFLKI
jgi:hypothetical protein